MNLIRKIKICELLNKPLNNNDKEIVDFIISKISNLTEFVYDKYPDSIFYMSPLDSMNEKGKWILEQDSMDNMDTTLYVRCENFWQILEDKYKFKHVDIQIIMKYLVEKTLNIKTTSLTWNQGTIYSEVEVAYKNK